MRRKPVMATSSSRNISLHMKQLKQHNCKGKIDRVQLIKHYAMKVNAGVMYRSNQVFLALALVGGEWSDSCPSPFNPPPQTLWIGGCVGSRIGLDNLEKRKFCTLSGFKL
jgi:hypothetical protein